MRLVRTNIRWRLALAIVLTAIIPVVASVFLARSMVKQSSERFFVPEIRQHLELSLGAYQDLARQVKATMRHQATLIASDATLVAATQSLEVDRGVLKARLGELLANYPDIVSLTVDGKGGEPLAGVDRGRPLDEQKEHRLAVVRSLGDSSAAGDDTGGGFGLTALFAASRSRFEEFTELGEFIEAYTRLEERRESHERTYVAAFAALLGITIVLAIGVGTLLARGVTRRLSELARATREVAAGDLTIRVRETANDEIGDLVRAFNRMLQEVDTSRSRIEYLSRLASWQEMARRLAHEIKNPLTPIQLAVQEMHQRFSGAGAEQRKLLDVTLEIVQSEVQTLRRLVGEFSEFARLPESSIESADLTEFLLELKAEAEGYPDQFQERGVKARLNLEFSIDEIARPVMLDRQMMRRVLANLLSNAVEAASAKAGLSGVAHVRLSADEIFFGYRVLIDDSGPGIAEAERARAFEPYFTTKEDGTGLGLAIAKKIVLDHGGQLEFRDSPLGGARLSLLLPRASDYPNERAR